MKFKGIEKVKMNKNMKDNVPSTTNFFGGEGGLKIITLSGTESVTKNMTVYEYGDDIIIVDCGIGFPDAEMLGVDVVIPDMTYLMENSHKIKGLLLTHGHEDHIGAVPYLLRELNVPIYANQLVQGFLKEKLKEKRFSGLADKVSWHLISPEEPEQQLGSFTVSAFRLNHSVPMSMGFAIKSPEGTVLHMADYRIDWTPVLDKPIDLATIGKLGEEGVLCLLSDCLGITTDGYSKSETTLTNTFHEYFEYAKDRQILVTTISSNISRMYQIINAAIENDRKVVLAGRSIDQTVRVARSLGLLPFDENVFVTEEESLNYLQKDLVYIIAGCYGQQGSALDRVARGEHQNIVLEPEALVMFSADPNPPGVAEVVENLMDQLTLRGAEVIYSKIQENLHVSGHGARGDLVTIASIVRPKYFIPIGGTITKMRAYRNAMADLGFDQDVIFEQLEGDTAVFQNGSAKKGPHLEVQQVLVDGSGVGEIGPAVIKDREQLSTEGVYVVVVPMQNGKIIKGKTEVVTRGFVYVKESKALLGRSKDVVNKILEKYEEKGSDWGFLRHKIETDVEKLLYKETGRNPLVIAHSINL